MCCLSDAGVVCVWDVRARRLLARCDACAAVRGAGWRDAALVCGAAQCPHSAQHVVVAASDARTTLAVALLDVAAGACVSYTTRTYALPPLSPLSPQQQPQQTSVSTVWNDGSTYLAPAAPAAPEGDSSSGGVTAVLTRRSTVVCPEAWQCAARHAVTATVLAPDGLQCVALPAAVPSDTGSRAVDWAWAALTPPPLPPIDTYALHPRALLGTTFLCARGAALFHVVPRVE